MIFLNLGKNFNQWPFLNSWTFFESISISWFCEDCLNSWIFFESLNIDKLWTFFESKNIFWIDKHFLNAANIFLKSRMFIRIHEQVWISWTFVNLQKKKFVTIFQIHETFQLVNNFSTLRTFFKPCVVGKETEGKIRARGELAIHVCTNGPAQLMILL